MNIIADTLNSKANTQQMLTTFLLDMKQYFKNAQLLTEDKTYARILKVTETTQKCMPHFYSFTNIATKLIRNLRERIDDKFQDQNQMKEQNGNKNQTSASEGDQTITNEDLEALQKLHLKLSRENSNVPISVNLGRQINQQFLRKLVFDVIEQLREEIEQSEEAAENQLRLLLGEKSSVLLFDSHLQNKKLLNKIANEKNIKLKCVKISNADHKNNEINLAEVASQIRKFQKVIISAENVLKNGAVISQSGSLIVALAAKKYNIQVIILTRGFCFTEKSLIDQHVLLSENPMKFFKKSEENLKVYIGKRFDLLGSRLVSQIVSELGFVNPSNVELHFTTYYNYD